MKKREMMKPVVISPSEIERRADLLEDEMDLEERSEQGYTEQDVDAQSVEEDFKSVLSDLTSSTDKKSKKKKKASAENGCVSGITNLLAMISEFKLLTLEEERHYARVFRETGSREARDILFNHNIKLVVSIAKNYTSYCTSLDIMDLIGEGCDGLLKACHKYDPERGVKFSTYAVWWIKQTITRAIQTKDSIIRIPVHLLEKIKKAKEIIKKKEYESDRILTYQEIYDIALSLTKSGKNAAMAKDIVTYVLDGNKTFSSDAVVKGTASDDGRNESHLIDFISDDSIRLDGRLTNADMFHEVHKALDILADNEREVLIRRFGFFGRESETLESIGRDRGVTRERVRQIERNGFDKIRAVYPNLYMYINDHI